MFNSVEDRTCTVDQAGCLNFVSKHRLSDSMSKQYCLSDSVCNARRKEPIQARLRKRAMFQDAAMGGLMFTGFVSLW